MWPRGRGEGIDRHQKLLVPKGHAIAIIGLYKDFGEHRNVMHPLVASHRKEIAELCRHYRVRRLEVFGSAARGDDFDPARSDADFLVEFDNTSNLPALEEFFGFQEALAKLLGRDVDLVEAGAIRNPYVLASINKSKESVYAA